MDFEHARHNMIEQQIRTWEVLDQRVLDLLARVPREDFVPQDFRNLAFADMRIPLGHDQFMMMPKVEARLLQELDLGADDKVLEVGTGSGYLTALLARLGKEVYSVDIVPDFIDAARGKLAEHGITNVHLEVGDAAQGWDAHAPYDVIVITGSLPSLPLGFKESLSINGRLAAIIGESPAMEATIVRRTGESGWAERTVFETDLPPLLNATRPPAFVF